MGIRAQWKRDPGLVVSGGVHALALVLLFANFARPPKFEDAIETVPVEMITTSELNEIMNGEKTAKQMPQAQRRVDKVAELEDHKELPPTPDAKKDTPPEPSPDKANNDPGTAEKPPEPVATQPPPAPTPPVPATAPPPPPPPPQPTAEAPPTPPERPVEKAEAPTPPPKPEASKPDEVKPPPPDAEALDAPKPPPRPKPEKKIAKAEPKPVPLPHARPVEKKLAKVLPQKTPDIVPPPQPAPKPSVLNQVASVLDKLKPEKPKVFDQVASLLDKMKPDTPPKPVEKQRSGSEVKDAKPHETFSLDKISALIDHDAPQRKASTGQKLTQMASLGSPTAHSEKLSPSMAAQLDGWLIDHYRGCWSYFGLGAAKDYVPIVRIRMAQDGSLIGAPSLLNPTSDPNLRSLADSALRAVNRCNPLEIPDRFKPYYDQGYKQRVVRFDPKEMS